MQITIVGTINLDHIVAPEISRSGLGGILYNVAACSHLREIMRIRGVQPLLTPVAIVGGDRWEEIRGILKGLPGTEITGIRVEGQGINETWLHYDAQGRREETLTMRVRSLTSQDVVPHSEADAILVNFISGADLDAAMLAEIRSACSGVVLMDIQSLSLGFEERGERFLRAIPNWMEYACSVDIVKGNEQEVRLFSPPEIADGPLSVIAGSIMEQGPHTVVATQGAEGSTVFWREPGNPIAQIQEVHVSARLVKRAPDVTGCGDVYASAFLMSWLLKRTVPEAAEFASEAAGYCAASVGLEGLSRLAGDLGGSSGGSAARFEMGGGFGN